MTLLQRNCAILALLLLATVLVYVNGLSNPFVIDDRSIIFKNFRPGQSWTIGDLFERSLFARKASGESYFRPLTLLTFALNYPLAGEKPEGYRAFNIAIHLLVIVLTFLLLSHLAGRWVATFASLLFALHPAHVQAVSYISSRSDPLYTALALLSLLFWYKGSEAEGMRKRLYLSSALGAFFLGLFAKETMVVVPALAVVMDFIWNRTGSWRNKIRENLPWYGGFAALFAIYLFLRLSLDYSFLMEGGRELGLGSRVFIALKLLGLYLGLAFYPVHLALFRTVQVPQSFFEWQVVLGAILLAGMLILAWHLRQAHKEISLGILWYLISLLPVSNLTLLNAPMMEHWLYLPLIGLVLAFVGSVRTVAEWVGEVRGAALGLALLALLLSARTVTRNAEWGDLVKLFSRDISSNPGYHLTWFWLANALKKQGMLNDAIRALKTGLLLNPNFTRSWIDLGESLSLIGRNQEAEEAFSRALFIEPRDPLIHHMLAAHRLKMGKNLAAIDAVKRSIELKPSPGAYHTLGSAYRRLERREDAEDAFSKALAAYPRNRRYHGEVHVNFGKLYQDEGKWQEAQEEFEIALQFDPNSREAKELLRRGAKGLLGGQP
jgi:tetratricopeptide (TPR) repeat protein